MRLPDSRFLSLLLYRMDVIPLAAFCRVIYACAAASEMDRIFIVVHCERAGGDDASDAGAAAYSMVFSVLLL